MTFLTWEEYIKKNYSNLLDGGHWISKEDGRHVFIKEDALKKFEKAMVSLKKEQTSSPVPEEEWVEPLQWVLNKWRDCVFRQGVDGLLKEKSRQKLSSSQ